VTPAQKWASCAVPEAACGSEKDKDACCYYHVNIHSCLDKPGTFCGPWVGNDGHLATHTAAFHSSAGTDGKAIFPFDIKLFYEGRYTVIVHFKFAGMHFAIGRTSQVVFSDALCAVPTVPNKDGNCESCPVGSQPVSLGIPKGGQQLTDLESISLGVNPLCVPCPPGWYSSDGKECLQAAPGYYTNESWQTQEIPCAPGTSNPLYAMTMCLKCNPGQFAEKAAAMCSLCEKGMYGSASGVSSCTACTEIRTTESMGETSLAKCVCPSHHYAGPSNSLCMACKEGMHCPIASAYDNFALWQGGSTPRGSPIPELKMGYYTVTSSPLEVYRCDAETGNLDCPGGPPGSCATGRLGLNCAQCAPGWAVAKDGACQECGTQVVILRIACAIALVLIAIGAYYTCNSDFAVSTQNTLAFSCVAGVTVMAFQVLSLMPRLSIVWPKASGAVMGSFSIFLLSAEATGPTDCITNTAFGRFIVNCIPPVAIVVAVLFCFVSTQLIGFMRPGVAWDKDKTLNAGGMLLQSFFVGIAVLVSQPFQCYSHPTETDKTSMAMYPEVICWGDDHTPILGMALAVLFAFVIPFMVMCFWIICASSRAIVQKDVSFLRRFRFLIYRFNPKSAWWGSIFVVRMLLFAFAPIIPADYPHVQLLYLCTVGFTYVVFVCYFWPWKSHELSCFDVGVGVCLGLMACTATMFVEKPSNSTPGEVIVLCFLGLLGLMVVLILGTVAYWSFKHGLFGAFGPETGSKGDTKKLQQGLIDFVQKAQGMNEEVALHLVSAMGRMEQAVLSQLVTNEELMQQLAKVNPSVLAADGAPPTPPLFGGPDDFAAAANQDGKTAQSKQDEVIGAAVFSLV